MKKESILSLILPTANGNGLSILIAFFVLFPFFVFDIYLSGFAKRCLQDFLATVSFQACSALDLFFCLFVMMFSVQKKILKFLNSLHLSPQKLVPARNKAHNLHDHYPTEPGSTGSLSTYVSK